MGRDAFLLDDRTVRDALLDGGGRSLAFGRPHKVRGQGRAMAENVSPGAGMVIVVCMVSVQF